MEGNEQNSKNKILLFSIIGFFIILIIIVIAIFAIKGDDSESDGFLGGILKGKEEKTEIVPERIPPKLDENGNVVKTTEELESEYNKFNQSDEFKNFPETPEDDKQKTNANISDLQVTITKVESLLEKYHTKEAEKLINQFFSKNDRKSEDENEQKLIDKLSQYQIDINMMANIGMTYDDNPYIPRKLPLNLTRNQYIENLKVIKNPLSFFYAYLELPIEYHKNYTLDTKNSYYLHGDIENIIKLEKYEEITKEELGLDNGYFSDGYKNAWKIYFVYDKTALVATVVQKNDTNLTMVGVRLQEGSETNQFYTLNDWKKIDDNIEKGKPIFDGVDTYKVTDALTVPDEEELLPDYDISIMGGGF